MLKGLLAPDEMEEKVGEEENERREEAGDEENAAEMEEEAGKETGRKEASAEKADTERQEVATEEKTLAERLRNRAGNVGNTITAMTSGSPARTKTKAPWRLQKIDQHPRKTKKTRPNRQRIRTKRKTRKE